MKVHHRSYQRERRAVLPLLDGPVRRLHGHDARVESHQLARDLEGDGGARLGNDPQPGGEGLKIRIELVQQYRVYRSIPCQLSYPECLLCQVG